MSSGFRATSCSSSLIRSRMISGRTDRKSSDSGRNLRRNLYDNRPLVNMLNRPRFLPREAENVGLCALSAARAHRDRRP
ncbi:hypothetical protein FJ423_30905 [Mesorhizobium sp. B2-8-9]|nr:hypothetical protein FJ423_30905 [Mesorhizobium sp. B2-8-9]